MGQMGASARINGRRRRRLRARAMTGGAARRGILGAAAAPSGSARSAPLLTLRPAMSNAFGPLTPVKAILGIGAGTAAMIALVILATWPWVASPA
jgi:hypothetical protein